MMRTKTKLIVALAMSGLLGAGAALGADPFPVPHTVETVNAIEKDPLGWRGKVVAFPGKILRTEDGYEGRPLLRMLLPKPNPERQHVWVSSEVRAGASQFSVGDIVLVYGYLDLPGEDDPITAPVYDKNYHVRGLCLVNTTTLKMFAAHQAEAQCHAWRQGSLPEG